MRLVTRIFLSHLLVVVVVSGAIVVLAGIVSPLFYREHLQLLVEPTPDGMTLRKELSAGHERTMMLAFLSSLPLAIILAAVIALLEARRITGVVDRTARGSRELAEGHYEKRLEVSGNDELGAIALHFNQLAEALESNERTKNELIATIAHELRTPLSALQGYGEALVDRMLSPQTASEAINREVKAMRRVVEDLLLVSRLDAHAIELRPTTCSSSDLLFDAFDRYRIVFEEKGVELLLAPATQLPKVYVDYDRMIQILSNLLSNSLRHTASGGQVVLGASLEANEVEFFVVDDGEGIAKSHQPFIFDRFYQADAARSRRNSGSGIGLTVTKGLAEAMGGRIRFKSEVGLGSSFYVTVPISDTTPPQPG